MSKILPLVAFGLGFLGAGAFFSLYDGAMPYLSSFVIEDKYYLFMESLWSVFPAIIMFIGIVFLIAAGVAASKNTIQDVF